MAGAADALRDCGRVLVAASAASEDPHAELLAMVWGPRFDREHALALLRTQVGGALDADAAVRGVMDAAHRFDTLSADDQRHVRRVILRHRAQCQNATWSASS